MHSHQCVTATSMSEPISCQSKHVIIIIRIPKWTMPGRSGLKTMDTDIGLYIYNHAQHVTERYKCTGISWPTWEKCNVKVEEKGWGRQQSKIYTVNTQTADCFGRY